MPSHTTCNPLAGATSTADRRIALGFKAHHVAAAVGINRVTYSRIENGAACSPETRRRIDLYLECMEQAHRFALATFEHLEKLRAARASVSV